LAEMGAGADALEASTPGSGGAWRQDAAISSFLNRGMYAGWLAAAGRFEEAKIQGNRVIFSISGGLRATSEAAAAAAAWGGLAFAKAMLGDVEGAQQADAASSEAIRLLIQQRKFVPNIKDEYAHVMLTYLTEDANECERLVAEAESNVRQQLGGQPFADVETAARYPVLWQLYLRGDWQEAERVADALSEGYEDAIFVNVRSAAIGSIAKARGDRDRAWKMVRAVWPDGPNTDLRARYITFVMPVQRLAASLALEEGDLDTARRWLEANDVWMDWMGAVPGKAAAQAIWARWHHQSGNLPEAIKTAHRSLELASYPRQPIALLDAHRLLGQLYGVEGDPSGAKDHLDASLALARSCRAPYEEALTILALADHHIAARAFDMAETTLQNATERFESLGAHPALSCVAELQQRMATAIETGPKLPNGLSFREVEVLKLLAQGLSNQEIADGLFLSVRTVERHIANAYGKIGVHSRATATAYVLQNLT